MPVYEYRCAKCRRKTSVFVRGFTVSGPVTCEHCGSQETARAFSTFAVGKSSQPDLQKMADDLSTINPNDPRSMARAMREANADTDLPPDAAFDDMLERMDRGEVPDDFEQVMSGGHPDFADDDAGDGGDDES
jgi:putative FmdB family regulatory protein